MASEIPMPAAMIRSVPGNTESPIPDNGPMSAAFTELMVDVSKFLFFAFCSSIAMVRPPMNEWNCGVMLKNSMFRFRD